MTVFRKRRFGAIGSPAAPAARRSCSSRSWLFFRKRWFGAIGLLAAPAARRSCSSRSWLFFRKRSKTYFSISDDFRSP
ncbi:hypothetical protein [Paenibacillus thiaminolyticus]|uniref:Uncharacterized protein n=1 Tax=Paenibacillus thiaminolyticus TaxID=49283 RepID=A0A3A3GQT7_PANTH|nr:hypothetical protein [Paenibacillus thiaminolyticus]RJG15631.1 hypothetical protein DQX05_29560 [Paenibacillus thiaminolyticus]